MSKISYGVYKAGFKEAEKMPLVVVAWQAGRLAEWQWHPLGAANPTTFRNLRRRKYWLP